MRQILVFFAFAIALLIAGVDAQEPSARPPDADGNGIPDPLQQLLGGSLRPLARRDSASLGACPMRRRRRCFPC